MNLHRANSICRWYMAQYVKKKEAAYEVEFPGSGVRFPVPTFYMQNLEQCVLLIEKLTVRLSSASIGASPHVYYSELMCTAEQNAKRDGMAEDWEREYVSGMQKQRFVVASACKYGDLITVVGARHFSPAMHSQLDQVPEDKMDAWIEDNPDGHTEGFVDQFDVFMTRAEAWEVAIESGQLNLRRYHGHCVGELHSEDLW